MGKSRKSETAASGGGTPGAAPGTVPPGVEGLAQAAARVRGPAPVHLWNPPHCGHSLMRIGKDGTWFHEGTPIGRVGLVRLFASILRRDAQEFVLVTPAERVTIDVEDAPFVAVDVERAGDGLRFTTNLGDEAVAGPANPIRVERSEDGEPRPYVLVRGGLEALIDRKTFYRLVDLAVEEGGEWVVRSGGTTFALGPASDPSP